MTSLIIGRFQPFHKGHERLIRKVMKYSMVVVAIRDTKKSKDNPYSYRKRKRMIKRVIGVKVIRIPDIDEIVYGRNVGYGIREVRLDKETELISGTKLRNNGGNNYE